MLLLLAGLAAAPGAGGAASARPVMRVDWTFLARGGSRPPDIVATRIVGHGRLEFSESPLDGTQADADSATGTVVAEWDVLHPVPHEVQMRFAVYGAMFGYTKATDVGGAFLLVKVVGSTGAAGTHLDCKVGSIGLVRLASTRASDTYRLTVPRCSIDQGQQARGQGTKKVAVKLEPRCLRATSASEPICAGSAPPPAATWSGTWKRNEVAGNLILTQSASGTVSGSWTWNDGTGKVSGTTKNGQLTGTFTESCCAGSFDLRLGGKNFSGSYTCTRGCNGSGSFSGTCIAGGCLKNT